MPYCPACGQEVGPEAAFCSNCGHEFTGELPVRSNTPQPQNESPSDIPTVAETRDVDVPDPWTVGRKATAVSGMVGAIAAFLPWITLQVVGTSATWRGIRADGQLTAIAAALVFIVAAWRWGPWQRGVSFVFGLFIFGLGSIYISDPLAGAHDQLTPQQEQLAQAFTPGIGLYLTAISGLIILAAVVYDTWFNPELTKQSGGRV